MKQFFLLLSFLCVLVGCIANQEGDQIDVERPQGEPTARMIKTESTAEPTLTFEEVMASVTPPPNPLPVTSLTQLQPI